MRHLPVQVLKMDILIVKVEIYDADFPVAIIESEDECSAKMQFDGFINPGNWPEVSEKIGEALNLMFPEKAE